MNQSEWTVEEALARSAHYAANGHHALADTWLARAFGAVRRRAMAAMREGHQS